MKSTALPCPSCGEALKVPKDVETLACTRCGMQFTAELGKGSVSLKMLAEIKQPMEADTKAQERAASELAIIQLNQELGLLGTEKESLEEKIKEVERRIHEKRSGIALVLFIDNMRRAFSRSRIEQQQERLQEELAAKQAEIADKLQELKHHISKL